MERIEGAVKRYAWGDPTFIPELLGIEPDGEPWAELWLGTHPSGPSRLTDGSPLVDLCGPLPYLLKVLSATEPLSLQTHPNAVQAAAGHAAGLFSDPNPKPELLCALTPFRALCGIRPVDATIALLQDLGIDELARALVDGGPSAALDGLYHRTIDARPIIDACATSDRPEARSVSDLDARYRGDPSVAVMLLLNHVELQPGQALRLEAGNLHCYLHGSGIELMGASDNVVRGGLTRKPVDVEQLLETVDPTPLERPVLPVAERYELPAADVALQHLDIGETYAASGDSLAIELNGASWYIAPGDIFVPKAPAYVVDSSR